MVSETFSDEFGLKKELSCSSITDKELWSSALCVITVFAIVESAQLVTRERLVARLSELSDFLTPVYITVPSVPGECVKTSPSTPDFKGSECFADMVEGDPCIRCWSFEEDFPRDIRAEEGLESPNTFLSPFLRDDDSDLALP